MRRLPSAASLKAEKTNVLYEALAPKEVRIRVYGMEAKVSAMESPARLEKAAAERSAGEDARQRRPGAVSMDAAVYVNLAVVDGADKVVYSDARDGNRWQQPLSVATVEAETRHRDRSLYGDAVAEARVVRALSAVTPAIANVSLSRFALPGATPYAAGKSAAARPPHRAAAEPAAVRSRGR